MVKKVEHDYTHENKNIIRINLKRLHTLVQCTHGK